MARLGAGMTVKVWVEVRVPAFELPGEEGHVHTGHSAGIEGDLHLGPHKGRSPPERHSDSTGQIRILLRGRGHHLGAITYARFVTGFKGTGVIQACATPLAFDDHSGPRDDSILEGAHEVLPSIRALLWLPRVGRGLLCQTSLKLGRFHRPQFSGLQLLLRLTSSKRG